MNEGNGSELTLTSLPFLVPEILEWPEEVVKEQKLWLPPACVKIITFWFEQKNYPGEYAAPPSSECIKLDRSVVLKYFFLPRDTLLDKTSRAHPTAQLSIAMATFPYMQRVTVPCRWWQTCCAAIYLLLNSQEFEELRSQNICSAPKTWGYSFWELALWFG